MEERKEIFGCCRVCCPSKDGSWEERCKRGGCGDGGAGGGGRVRQINSKKGYCMPAGDSQKENWFRVV